MKAIGYKKMGPLAMAEFIEFTADVPKISAHDLLVEVHGVSLNPVDTKVRQRAEPADTPKVLGYDAAGIVKQVGADVSKFAVGDEVFYAGDITRPGTNSELHVVDERIVGKKPSSLSMAEAAGMPLTSITAWEILFDSLNITKHDDEAILVIGGAGGVGSILIQLAKKLTNLTVIASASRKESIDWVKKMGADQVIDHSKSIDTEIESLGIQPKYVAALNATDQHFDAIVNLIKPRGSVAIIDNPEALNINAGKQKSIRFAWEFMFTRSMFNTIDIDEQHKLLNSVSEMLDSGVLISTVTSNLGKLSLETLIEAHKLQEAGRVIGKNVLEGFH
ncbi:MAG: zinc-binding alcohol dehydrogenase family protein [Burkholderiales bacterium]|nr:MAG: Zn-dependent oxidoreductase [Betaproteobacteria bacterium TMED22]|tara:strand:+ start:8642 stop:9640 length:999 start_codon:yes stop_codon:yes gene_type:complete